MELIYSISILYEKRRILNNIYLFRDYSFEVGTKKGIMNFCQNTTATADDGKSSLVIFELDGKKKHFAGSDIKTNKFSLLRNYNF
jgi:hypothetical protein